MLKYSIVVVEDEAIIRRDIEAVLKKHGHEVVASCASGEEALEACLEYRPQLVLMDIVLTGKGSGIDAANLIREKVDVPVIFLTANTDPATVSKARTAQPYGFIRKPFTALDMLTTIEVAMHNHEQGKRVRNERDRLRDTVVGRTEQTSLFVKVNGRLEGVRYGDIHYVDAQKDYVGIHLNDRRIVAHSTLTNMEKSLPTEAFLRVHRSYIVRVDRIKAVEGMNLIMEKNDQVIPIGGHHLEQVRRRLGLE